MNEATAIQIFKEYPKEKFLPLVPVQTLTQISPLHKVGVNVVQISTDEKDKDVYKEKNGEHALTKKGLMKLMAVANIQVVESRSVTPSSCQRCLEMARATGKPCACGGCECKFDIAWQVTIAVPDLSGGFRRVTATREFICADERKKAATEKQYEQAFAFRSAHTESKALNRALREALMIKSTYRVEELSKPFAVPVISPNFDDPDLKSAMVSRFAQGENSLFGRAPALPSAFEERPALEAPEEIVIPPEDEGDFFSPDEGAAEPVDTEPLIECHRCGAILEGFSDSKTGEWSVDRLADFTRSRFGHPLCRKCTVEALKERTAS